MKKAVFDPEAEHEFLEAVKYYEDSQHGLGQRFRLFVEIAVRKLVESPFTYRILKAPFRRYLIPKFPYSIIYAIEPDHIRIIAIAHNRRKPGYWSNRSRNRTEKSGN